MSKIAVVYWSGTGNTESMADAVAQGAKGKGAEVKLFTPDSFNSSMVDDFDAVAFGCPAMGAEELEESEFEPMFSDCESKLGGKKIALFGSYGASVVSEPVICNEAPDDSALDECKALGAALV